MLYLDTSALLKLYIRGSGSEAVEHQVASQDLPLARHAGLDVVSPG